MGLALVLSVATHAILVFGIGFKMLHTPEPAPTLEVTIAQHRSEKAPENADFIAQVHQLGSGDAPDKTEITRGQIPPSIDVGDQIFAVPDHAKGTDAPAPEVIASTTPVDADLHEGREQGRPTGDVSEAAALQLEIGGLRARLADRRREYARFPRTLRLTAASAKSAEQAAYLGDWVTRVEDIGNRHYPEEARSKRIFGEVRMAVTVRPDGSVAAVDILQGSSQRVLDQAALRTVRLAAPFAGFPAEMRGWDRLEIIRTWRFVPGERLSTR